MGEARFHMTITGHTTVKRWSAPTVHGDSQRVNHNFEKPNSESIRILSPAPLRDRLSPLNWFRPDHHVCLSPRSADTIWTKQPNSLAISLKLLSPDPGYQPIAIEGSRLFHLKLKNRSTADSPGPSNNLRNADQ